MQEMMTRQMTDFKAGSLRRFAWVLSIGPPLTPRRPVRTPFQEAAQSSPELIQQFLADIPMKRFGEPEAIGDLVLFMCSDACPFMTADTVDVNDGGWR